MTTRLRFFLAICSSAWQDCSCVFPGFAYKFDLSGFGAYLEAKAAGTLSRPAEENERGDF